MSSPKFNDPEMQEIFEGFLVETKELLDNLSQDLMLIENQPDDLELLNRIFRSCHTIKGTSAFMGFEKITEITHHGEDLLNKLRKSELQISLEIIDVLLEVHDWIKLLVDKLQTGEDMDVDYTGTIAQIDKLRHQSKEEQQATIDVHNEEAHAYDVQPIAEASPEEEQITEESTLQYIFDNPTIFNHEGDFTEGDLDMLEKAFAEINQNFGNSNPNSESEKVISTIDEHTSVVSEPNQSAPTPLVEIKPEPPKEPLKAVPSAPLNIPDTTKHTIDKPASAAATTSQAADTIRVDVSRVEALMDLSGELVLGRNRLAQITEQISKSTDVADKIRELIETTSQVDFVTSEIQTAVMRMRMVPIGKLYQKAPRIVRDLAKEFGKKIKLVLKGEETEIDRGIIEELNDPLVHMIRNSCDHGVESPEERMKNGKPAEGIITLDAYQEGNNIVMKIIDDGKGMDAEKLKEKAVEKGLITAEQATQMTKRDAFQLIFAPGFSTAVKVSAVSGRGVGMDVVRTNIQKLKGLIDIESEIGLGSTFIIKLPLTLAIIQGLLINVQHETYAIPLSSVEEVVAIDMDSVYSVNQQEVIRIRANVLPLVRLDKTLNSPNIEESLEKKYVVVVGLDVHRIGLVVDELLGQQEIVIKSIGEYLGHIPGMAGSTILGDGRVIMIIDIADLILNNKKQNFLS